MIDGTPVTIVLTPTARDLTDASRYMTWRRLGPYMGAFAGLMLLTALALRSPFVVGAVLLYVVSVLALWEIMLRRRARQQASTAAVIGGATYIFSDEGIHARSSVTDSTMKWGAVAHAYEGARTVFLVYINNVALCMPYRAMTAEQLAALRALVKRQLGSKASLKG